jgi:pyridoxamine 5'-phosphate oxidase
MKNLHDDRKEYCSGELLESTAPKKPLELFAAWFEEHQQTTSVDATTMTLATVHLGQPSARIVLLKSFGPEGLEFFTNYTSNKGLAISDNPSVGLMFFWPNQERQVRVLGRAVRLTAAENDAYFQSRPLESRVGAVISHQSAPVSDRAELEKRFAQELERAKIHGIECPEHWGGYRVVPHQWEFWQGRPSRLHDRLVYSLVNDGWNLERLNP